MYDDTVKIVIYLQGDMNNKLAKSEWGWGKQWGKENFLQEISNQKSACS